MNFFKSLKTDFKGGSAAEKLGIISSLVTIFGIFSIPSLIYLQYTPNILFAVCLMLLFFAAFVLILYVTISAIKFVLSLSENVLLKIFFVSSVLGFIFFLLAYIFFFLSIAHRDIFSKIM